MPNNDASGIWGTGQIQHCSSSGTTTTLRETVPELLTIGSTQGGPSKGENHPKHIPLKGVIATELGSELRFIPLESLSRDRRS
jgi:hypothetical protein